MTRRALVRINGSWTLHSAGIIAKPVASIASTQTSSSSWAFDASASSSINGSIVSYAWNFGDGATGTGASTSHIYGSAGLYTVTLTVTDSVGATNTASVTVGPDNFILGTTKPTAANSGAGVVRAFPTGSGGTLTGNQAVGGSTVLSNRVINGDVTLSGTAQLLDCVVHGKVICTGSANRVENNLIDFATGSDYGASAGVSGGDVWAVLCNNATSQAQVWFNTIRCRTSTYKVNGIGARNFYAYRNDISAVVDGMSVYCLSAASTSANVRIEGNYIHELQFNSPDPNHNASGGFASSTHNDGIQFQGNADTISVKGNSIDATWSTVVGTNVTNTSQLQPPNWNQLAAIMLTPNVISTEAITFDSNWFDDGVYTVNGGAAAGGIFTFTNNRFGGGDTLKHWVINPSASLTQSGNVDQNGNPITATRST